MINESKQCPESLYGGQDIGYQSFIEDCRVNQSECLKTCLAGDANRCLGLGHVYVDIEDESLYSNALYARACKLGAVSACTNRAAGIQKYESSRLGESCSYKTFKLTCKNNDEWGCTMLGLSLYKGLDTTKDHKEALKVLHKSCEIDEEHEACGYARSMIKNILDETKQPVTNQQPGG